MDFTETKVNIVNDIEQQVAITVEPFRRSWRTSVSGLDWSKEI